MSASTLRVAKWPLTWESLACRGSVERVRTPVTILAASLFVSALVGCTTSTEPPATPTATASASAGPTSAEPVPTEESAGASLEPVAKPSPKGGPWTTVDVSAGSAEQIRSDGALPESLRIFLASRIGVEDVSGCTLTGVEVRAVHQDGYAYGSEASDCGGDQQVIWGIADGQWNYILAFEDAIPCTEFSTNEVPKGIPGVKCLTDTSESTNY